MRNCVIVEILPGLPCYRCIMQKGTSDLKDILDIKNPIKQIGIQNLVVQFMKFGHKPESAILGWLKGQVHN